MKLGVAAALAAALAALAVTLLLATGSSPADSTTAARRTLAAHEVRRLLAELPLPARTARPGGQGAMAAGSATPSQGALAGLGEAVASDVVQRGLTVTVKGDAATVRAYLLAHVPGDARATDGGLGLVPRHLPGGLAAAGVRLTLAPAGPHATEVRAIGSARWLIARAASERVPPTARRLVITRGRPGHRPGLVLTVGGERMRRIAALLNGLATVQPGAVYHCPPAVVGLPRVTFTFRARSGGRVLARASEDADVVSPTTACDAMRFAATGHEGAPLLGGAHLLREVSALVHRRLWLAPYAA